MRRLGISGHILLLASILTVSNLMSAVQTEASFTAVGDVAGHGGKEVQQFEDLEVAIRPLAILVL